MADNQTRNQVVNYVHGYTYEADPATGAPLAVRDWTLGGIVHSGPVVVDYYDAADISVVLDRYIVIGANDGMLHVFDDADGSEVFAFIPEQVLLNLALLPDNPIVDTVDGNISLFRSNLQPKYLVFGLRRGGGAYWCLNVIDPDPLSWDRPMAIHQCRDRPVLGQTQVCIRSRCLGCRRRRCGFCGCGCVQRRL